MLALLQCMTPVLERQLLTFLAGVGSDDAVQHRLCLHAAMSCQSLQTRLVSVSSLRSLVAL